MHFSDPFVFRDKLDPLIGTCNFLNFVEMPVIIKAFILKYFSCVHFRNDIPRCKVSTLTKLYLGKVLKMEEKNSTSHLMYSSWFLIKITLFVCLSPVAISDHFLLGIIRRFSKVMASQPEDFWCVVKVP